MRNSISKLIIVLISLFVGLLHFLIGPDYQGVFKNFIRGYLIDILLPMNLYLLLQISLRQHFALNKARLIGISSIFSFGIVVELLQANGIHFLGNTYDPLDILMYGLGIAIGVTIDLVIIDQLEKNGKEKGNKV